MPPTGRLGTCGSVPLIYLKQSRLAPKLPLLLPSRNALLVSASEPHFPVTSRRASALNLRRRGWG